MKKFNSLFIQNKTKVKLNREYGYRLVKEINKTRDLIKVMGCTETYKRCDIITFTNKSNVEMFPALEDLYITDQYSTVFELRLGTNICIGKLNGRSLKQFINDQITI